MAEIGETSARNKADIAGTDHGDTHNSSALGDSIGNDGRAGNAAPLVGFTRISEISDVRQWRAKSVRLTQLDTSNFDSIWEFRRRK